MCQRGLAFDGLSDTFFPQEPPSHTLKGKFETNGRGKRRKSSTEKKDDAVVRVSVFSVIPQGSIERKHAETQSTVRMKIENP